MILDDENILIESAKECATNPIIILKNKVNNRGRFIEDDVKEIIEDFNINNPQVDLFKSQSIKYNIYDKCINISKYVKYGRDKGEYINDRILSIQVFDNEVRFSFTYIARYDEVQKYIVAKYKLEKFRNLNRVYTLNV